MNNQASIAICTAPEVLSIGIKRQVDGDSVASCLIDFGLWKDIDILISGFNNAFVSDYQEKCVYESQLTEKFCDRSATGYGFICDQPILSRCEYHWCQQKSRNGLSVGFLTRPELKFMAHSSSLLK
ncbi:hypothetical protein [Nostoc sp.]|uniref:hypothetical protein n=1 Tax=Nostoc sp. TaxID=1180 RepID=UPI002FFC45AB